MPETPSKEQLRLLDAYWRAANYLSVGQIFLRQSAIETSAKQGAHQAASVGSLGTTPGLTFIYAHLNRVIKARDLDMIYITGPGHGGPALVANAYLEGTYSEVYPHISPEAEGMKKLFKQFSFPGGIPSHVAPETPGSINEGGELGYSLAHAYGAAFDNPDLVVACVAGGSTCYQVHGIRSERPTFLYSTRPFEIHHLPAALKFEMVCLEERCDEIVRLIARRARTEIAATALSPSSTWIRCRIREIEASS